MNATNYAIRLIIDGYVVVPDVLTPDEVQSMSNGFERRAGELDKRWMNWEEICEVPELMSYIAHPRLMEVVDAFYVHYGQESVFANSAGIRDVFDPSKPVPAFDASDLRNGPYGWHDDVWGIKKPNAPFLPTALTSLLYLDETFADNGAYCTAVGSHHLAYAEGNKPIMPPAEIVLDNCELRPLPVKPGSVIIHRSHEWHAVVPTRQQRRVMLQTFCARTLYDLQEGHTQVSEATAALLPADRHKYLCHYSAGVTW